jgi:hypothetical protein
MPNLNPEQQFQADLDRAAIMSGLIGPRWSDDVIAFEAKSLLEEGVLPEADANEATALDVARATLKDAKARTDALTRMRAADPTKFIAAAKIVKDPNGKIKDAFGEQYRLIVKKQSSRQSGVGKQTRALAGIAASKARKGAA